MKESVFKGNPTFETDRLILRKLTIKDAPDIFEYASDSEVPKYMLWDAHKSIEDTKAFIRSRLAAYRKDEAGEWALVLKETGKLIGCLGFTVCDVKNKRCEIGYVLNRKYWGNGYMPEAASRVIEFVFKDMGLNRVECYHFADNDKSGRVMQKAGMSYEGMARQKAFAKDRIWDVKMYAILKEDWEKRSQIGEEGNK
jgi:ribosomal-protein-alanine N-acetyltransferase